MLIQTNHSVPPIPPKGKMGVRIAAITGGSVPDIAELHLEAFKGEMHARLGKAYVQANVNWFRTAHRGIALVAFNERDQTVGYVVGAPAGYTRAMNRDLLFVGCRAMVRRPWLLFKSNFLQKIKGRIRLTIGSSPVPHEEPTLSTPTMSLVSIAVSPSKQGNHIGRRLIEVFEVKARQLNMQSMRLSVYSRNLTAQGFYKGRGWKAFTGLARHTGEIYYYKDLSLETKKADRPRSR